MSMSKEIYLINREEGDSLPIPPIRLQEIYELLELESFPNQLRLGKTEKVDPRAKLIQKGLIWIFIRVTKKIHVCYSRLMPSARTTIEVEKIKLVVWDKNLQRLLVDKSGYEDGIADLDFVTSFPDELVQGLLAQGTATAAADNSLSKQQIL
ncbi:hypothetical protein ACLB2K_013357 [Fragaria x ananassa]